MAKLDDEARERADKLMAEFLCPKCDMDIEFSKCTCADNPLRTRIETLEGLLGEARGEFVTPTGHSENCVARFNDAGKPGYDCRCGWPEIVARIDAVLKETR